MNELDYRKITENDEDIFEEFIFEHIANDEYNVICDNSLITGKPYLNYKNYHKWYEIHSLIEQYKYADDNTQAFNYFLLKNTGEYKQVVAIIEMRTVLSSKTEPFGNLTIDVRPIERKMPNYKEALEISLKLASSLNMDKVILKFLDTDKYILDVMNKYYKDIPMIQTNNVYTASFYIKEIGNKKIEDYKDFIDSYVYVTTSKLYEDKLDKGLIGECDIVSSVNNSFDKNSPYNYVYVCDKENFCLNKDNKMELIDSITPNDIVKVNYEEIRNLNKVKKL